MRTPITPDNIQVGQRIERTYVNKEGVEIVARFTVTGTSPTGPYSGPYHFKTEDGADVQIEWFLLNDPASEALKKVLRWADDNDTWDGGYDQVAPALLAELANLGWELTRK